jgi:predicted nuclease of restriction endonuclease-like (RecB) superfamily
MTKRNRSVPAGYSALLAGLKARVRSAQLRAAVSVNRELILLYWDIGKAVVKRQKKYKWGDQAIDRLSSDLVKTFPQMAGFSRHNLYRMRAFYLGYSRANSIVAQPVLQLPKERKNRGIPTGTEFVAQPVLQMRAANLKPLIGELNPEQPPAILTAIPWGQNVLLLQKLKDPALRLWYAHKAIEHGWSRAVLTHHIENHFTSTKAKPLPIFNLPCRRRSPTLRSKRSKTHTTSTRNRKSDEEPTGHEQPSIDWSEPIAFKVLVV